MTEREHIPHLEVIPWNRRHRRAMTVWPAETNPLVHFYTMRSPQEPMHIAPENLAVLADGELAGRFTYRIYSPGVAFVGFALSPRWRGRRIAIPSMRGCLARLASYGLDFAYGWVASANRAAMMMDLHSGYIKTGAKEWRPVAPADALVAKWSLEDAGANTAYWTYADGQLLIRYEQVRADLAAYRVDLSQVGLV